MTTDMHDFESPWQPKVWGEVQHVFNSPDVAVSVLKVKAGFRCSRHWHEHRANRFVVTFGRIDVHLWDSVDDLKRHPNGPMSLLSLWTGRTILVPASIPHMFVVIESGC